MPDTGSQKIQLQEASLMNAKAAACLLRALMQITACAMLYYTAYRQHEKTKMMQLGRKKGVWGALVLALCFTWI